MTALIFDPPIRPSRPGDRPEPWSLDFRSSLENLINRFSKENGSNTPDFILADYLDDCLRAFDSASVRRERWYGHGHEPGGVVVPMLEEQGGEGSEAG